jgi:hypothetical protein
MATKSDAAAAAVSNNITGRSAVPFTGGLLMLIYAFFWPEQYGHWLGTIVHAFRAASGI